jgi:hypothetical protein
MVLFGAVATVFGLRPRLDVAVWPAIRALAFPGELSLNQSQQRCLRYPSAHYNAQPEGRFGLRGFEMDLDDSQTTEIDKRGHPDRRCLFCLN